jgi:transitional endoplasmic reticulum ATPase
MTSTSTTSTTTSDFADELRIALGLAEKKVHVAEIVRHGDKLVLPAAMEPQEAIDVLKQYIESQERETKFSETIDCFPWDGALALWRAANEIFGLATPVPTPGFFRSDPPELITIPTGLNQTAVVPWGSITLPGIEGRIQTAVGQAAQTKRITFRATAIVKRKHEPQMRALFARTKEIALTQSIYKGQAIKLRFRDDDGDPIQLPQPHFLDLSATMETQLVLNRDTQAVVDTALFTPLLYPQQCRDTGIPLKRGIMLSGPYGTGKTLLAYVAGKKASESGWTFCYCERADELAHMVAFAHQYQPALVFCEDIDRVLSGERDLSIDALLNIIDGIESKQSQIMVVLTTNDISKINRAMLRPGRLDAVIEVGFPDADAVERLIRVYGGQWLKDPDESFAEVGEVLAKQSPAVVRECVERSKLSAIKLNPRGPLQITAAALFDAAIGMRYQLDLLQEKPQALPWHEQLGRGVETLVERAAKKPRVSFYKDDDDDDDGN